MVYIFRLIMSLALSIIFLAPAMDTPDHHHWKSGTFIPVSQESLEKLITQSAMITALKSTVLDGIPEKDSSLLKEMLSQQPFLESMIDRKLAVDLSMLIIDASDNNDLGKMKHLFQSMNEADTTNVLRFLDYLNHEQLSSILLRLYRNNLVSKEYFFKLYKKLFSHIDMKILDSMAKSPCSIATEKRLWGGFKAKEEKFCSVQQHGFVSSFSYSYDDANYLEHNRYRQIRSNGKIYSELCPSGYDNKGFLLGRLVTDHSWWAQGKKLSYKAQDSNNWNEVHSFVNTIYCADASGDHCAAFSLGGGVICKLGTYLHKVICNDTVKVALQEYPQDTIALALINKAHELNVYDFEGEKLNTLLSVNANNACASNAWFAKSEPKKLFVALLGGGIQRYSCNENVWNLEHIFDFSMPKVSKTIISQDGQYYAFQNDTHIGVYALEVDNFLEIYRMHRNFNSKRRYPIKFIISENKEPVLIYLEDGKLKKCTIRNVITFTSAERLLWDSAINYKKCLGQASFNEFIAVDPAMKIVYDQAPTRIKKSVKKIFRE